jgi:hypothetical protein
MRGVGRVMFAAVMLMIIGVINIVYGIGALDEANVFVGDTRLIWDNLNALGWVLIVVGIVQITGGVSLASGNVYGQVIGIFAAGLGAINALLSVGGAYPWWSLGVFVVCVWVIWGIIVYAEDEDAERSAAARRTPGP